MSEVGFWTEPTNGRNQNIFIPNENVSYFQAYNGNHTQTIIHLKDGYKIESVENCSVLVDRYTEAMRRKELK